MKTRVERIGGDLAILVPEALAGELGVIAGSEVRLDLVDDALVVTAERPLDPSANGLFGALPLGQRPEAGRGATGTEAG